MTRARHPKLVRHLESRGRDCRIRRHLLVIDALHIAAAEPERERVRELRAADRVPVAKHDVVIEVAIDVVGVARAHRHGRLAGAVEQDDVTEWPGWNATAGNASLPSH